MKSEGISIIIPCYNTELYLEKCLTSIINQKLKEFEVILVDDCSTDNTISVIKKFTQNYPNFKLIENIKNQGAGYNRNIALKEAKYDIISFIDSDDYLEDNFYSELLKVMKAEKADVSVCDLFIRFDNSLSDESDIRAVSCVGDKTKENFLNTGHAASPCNKLFKKDLLLKYPFPTGIMNEDVATVLSILISCKKIAYTSKTFYNYIQREKSVQNSSISFKRFDIFKSIELLKERVSKEKNFKKYFDIVVYQQIIMFYIYIPPKEKNFFRRYKFLKKLGKIAKKYKIRKNNYLWNFLSTQGKLHKIYFKIYLKLNDSGFYLFTDILILFYKLYSQFFKKNVIPKKIDMTKLIKMAKKQKKLKLSKNRISVVIPNYNYENFLYQRIYSILSQREKLFELIILDDCSNDNSRKLIDEIVENLQNYINVKKVYNTKNSGSAFKQWEKGFNIATGDYVWIAEADDYCNPSFLKNILLPIKNDSDIVISYSDTAFIDKSGKIICNSVKNDIDILNTGHWDNNFVAKGIDEIKEYAFLNCTIANVSSVVFKKDNYNEFFKMSGKFKQAGDWLFYINIMTKGKVAFSNKALNFYRLHGNNVTSVTKKQVHFNEIVKVHEYVNNKFKLTKKQKEHIQDRYKFLKKAWNLYE